MSVQFESNLGNVQNSMNRNLDRTLTKIGLYLEGKIKLKITELGAVDTGYLRNSIDHKVKLQEKKVVIGTNTEYALNVHEGTRRMRKRDYMKSTAYEEKNNIKRIVQEGFSNV